jgi:hypothetical protein
MLSAVSPELFSRGVYFKYVKSRTELLLKNSKYGDRRASGKFITVYPKSDDDFVLLVQVLADATIRFAPGPYILSDRRYRESNVYYRYGGFVERIGQSNGHEVLVIEGPDGQLEEDVRGVVYSQPAWVSEPAKMVSLNPRVAESDDLGPLSRYAIDGALHFSNGGGVYTATDQDTGTLVVLKEGRPGAGVDGTGRDALRRLSHESKCLRALRGSPFVPMWLDLVNAWEHRFLVMERIDGMSLGTFAAKNYPFSRNNTGEEYVRNVIKYIGDMILGLRDIHARGIALGDVQPQNVICRETTDEEKPSICLIDFECSGPPQSRRSPGLGTRGFFGPEGLSLAQRDWFGMARLARTLFIPQGPVEDMCPGSVDLQSRWIRNSLGREAATAFSIAVEIARANGALRSPAQTGFRPVATGAEVSTDESLVAVLITALESTCDAATDGLAPGDIRQHEEPFGSLSVAYGGFGVALALSRSGAPTETVDEWISRVSLNAISVAPPGLFDGRSGIACVLAERGRTEDALALLLGIAEEDWDELGPSLGNGIAGIGLSMLGAYEHFGEAKFLEGALRAADDAGRALAARQPLVVGDPDGVPAGLLWGWTGLALFLAALHGVDGSPRFSNMAREAMAVELEECTRAVDDMLLLEVPDGRLMPYLGVGSAGIGIVLSVAPGIAAQQNPADLLGRIGEATAARPCYNGGLFRGSAGLLAGATAIDSSLGKHGRHEYRNAALDNLTLYLMQDSEGKIYAPGDFAYRLSADLASGAAGVLCALNDRNPGHFSWLPVLGQESIWRKLSLSGLAAPVSNSDTKGKEVK